MKLITSHDQPPLKLHMPEHDKFIAKLKSRIRITTLNPSTSTSTRVVQSLPKYVFRIRSASKSRIDIQEQ